MVAESHRHNRNRQRIPLQAFPVAENPACCLSITVYPAPHVRSCTLSREMVLIPGCPASAEWFLLGSPSGFATYTLHNLSVPYFVPSIRNPIMLALPPSSLLQYFSELCQ